jgi:hypothetical protein
MEKARKAVNLFLSEDVDAVMLCFAVWSEDEYLLPFRKLMEIVPSIEWVNTPYAKPPMKSGIMEIIRNSGIVGSFMSFGVNRMMGSSPRYVFGSTEDAGSEVGRPFEEIEKFARAASVHNKLKTVKLGVLPCRNGQMIVTYVDEFQLHAKIGPWVEYISVMQLKKAADSVPDRDVGDYVEKVKSSFSIDQRVNDENLFSSARASLGMEKIMNDMEIDGLALSDLNPELLEVMDLRPVLYPETLAKSNKVVGNEGDLGGTTAMVILHALTGKPVMFTEIFNVDTQDNVINTGHAGPGRPRLDPTEISVEDPLVLAMLRGSEDALGKKLPTGGSRYACDSPYYVNGGNIPTLIFGPGYIDNAHTYDEWVEVQQLINAAKVYVCGAMRYLGYK